MSLSFSSELDSRLRGMSTEEGRALVRVVSRLVLKGLAYERVFGIDPVNVDEGLEDTVTRTLRQHPKQEAGR